MQRYLAIISSSLRDIFAHKLRIILTSLGVIVGVVAVVGISAGAFSLQKNIVSQFESLGADTFYIVKFSFTHFASANTDRSVFVELFKRPSLELSYQEEFEKRVTSAMKIAPMLNYWKSISSDNSSGDNNAPVLATNEQMVGLNNIEINYGRFFIPSDIERRRTVCIIGPEIITEVFNGRDPIGKKLKIGGIPFTVIGVTDSTSGMQNNGQGNRMILIPVSTGIKYFKYGWNLQYVIQAKPGELDNAMEQATNTLRRLRGLRFKDKNNFDYMTADMILKFISRFTSVAYFVMISISAISLFVAGIGIMNVMYVTVSERTKEIGIRKSIGAFRKDILLQFTIEAILISSFGGIVGVGFIQLLVIVLQKVIPPDVDVIIYFPPNLAIFGIIFSIIVGVTFGIAPAIKASKLNIVDALRK